MQRYRDLGYTNVENLDFSKEFRGLAGLTDPNRKASGGRGIHPDARRFSENFN